jgi:acyl-CoA thioesterase FadM
MSKTFVFPHQRFPRVPPAPENAFVIQRLVEGRDLDSAEIVNNGVYAAHAEEVAARALAAVGWSPAYLRSQGLAIADRRMHIQYKSPAVWGEPLKVVTYLLGLENTGRVGYVAVQRATDGTRISECILDWMLVHRVTGKAQPLPESLSSALKTQVVP